MPVICGGVIICSSKEVNFDILGVTSCVGAAVLRGVKTIIQARLLTDAKMDPVELLYYMSPFAAIVLGAFAVCIEGIEPVLLVCWSPLRTPSTGVLTVIALLFATALNAWFLSIANFFVTYYTNAVTLQVL